MNPSFAAFYDEILFLKQAEPDEPQSYVEPANAAPVQDEENLPPPPPPPFKSDAGVLAKERLKSALKFGIGSGLGAGAGYLVSEKLLPKILPQGAWSAAARRNVGFGVSGLGAVGALALWEAMRTAAKAEEDAVKRHHQGV